MEKQMKIEIVRSKRKTIAIQIKSDLTVCVRTPLEMKDEDIQKFIQKHEGWIQTHLEKMKEVKKTEAAVEKLSEEEMRKLAEQALKVIPVKVQHYAKIMDVSYGRITIRNQRTRWGSCSSKRNLNFNCLLMLAPDKVVDYVVVHELCHLFEMNHSKAFWKQVEKVMPDYRIYEKWLKEHGQELMSRMC